MTMLSGLIRGDPVRAHTAPSVQERIDALTETSIGRASSGGAAQIGRRLGELEREWNIDRALMINFAVAGGFALTMASRNTGRRARGNRWLYLLRAQIGFLTLHAISGWCPPVVVMRRLGLRTQQEIDSERCTLEKLLGDQATSATH